jgi:hypothetical protein
MNAELPTWLVNTGAILAIILTILHIRDLLKAGRLEVRLTREVFFRLTDKGESLFANAVLLCRREPVEIRSIYLMLTRSSGSRKEYPVEPIWFGQKLAATGNVYAQHSFSSKSPASFIPENTAQNALYMCVLSEYATKVREGFRNLDQAGMQLFRARAELKDGDPAKASQLYAQLLTEQQKFLNHVMEAVQLEVGKYRLELRVKYRHVGPLLSRAKECRSEIEFAIEDGFREAFRNQVAAFAHERLLQATRGEVASAPLPEYEPLEVREITSA